MSGLGVSKHDDRWLFAARRVRQYAHAPTVHVWSHVGTMQSAHKLCELRESAGFSSTNVADAECALRGRV